MTGLRDVARLWAAFALLGAGLVHLAVVREHLSESALHGGFFAVVGAVQIVGAVATMARDRVPLPFAVVIGQLGLVLLWAVSRTVGLPVPPEAWTPEPVGRADLLAVTLELAAVAAAVLARAGDARRVGPTRPARLLLAAGAGALVASALTTPALAATEAGEHAHPHGEQHSAD